jgi:hypothetical protein
MACSVGRTAAAPRWRPPSWRSRGRGSPNAECAGGRAESQRYVGNARGDGQGQHPDRQRRPALGVRRIRVRRRAHRFGSEDRLVAKRVAILVLAAQKHAPGWARLLLSPSFERRLETRIWRDSGESRASAVDLQCRQGVDVSASMPPWRSTLARVVRRGAAVGVHRAAPCRAREICGISMSEERYFPSSAHTADAWTERICRSRAPAGAAIFSDVVTERRPSAVAAAHCTYPGKLPVWPYTVPQRVL